MLLHSLAPLTRSTLVPSCASSPQTSSAVCSLRLSHAQPSSSAVTECIAPAQAGLIRGHPTDTLFAAQCDSVVHSRGRGGARVGPDELPSSSSSIPPLLPCAEWGTLQPTGTRSRSVSEVRSLNTGGRGGYGDDWCSTAGGGSPQLRAAQVASVSHREQLRLSPGWSTRHCSPSPHTHSSLLRRAPGWVACSAGSSPAPSLSPASSSSTSPAASPASPRRGPRDCSANALPTLLRSRAGLLRGSGSVGGLGSPLRNRGPLLQGGAWLDSWHHRQWLEDADVARCLQNVGAGVAAELDTESESESEGEGVSAEDMEVEEEGVGADASSSWKDRRETEFTVTRVPGDGRCLFMSVVYGLCLVSGNPLPSSYILRCQWADKLRDLVAEEFIKRREETEWFLEGDFESYVSNIRKPHVWGGEPELLMLSHVLRYPVTVFIVEPTEGGEEEGIIPIAEYGQEYNFSPEGKVSAKSDMEEMIPPRTPICVLYNGFNHYDSVQLLPLEEKMVVC